MRSDRFSIETDDASSAVCSPEQRLYQAVILTALQEGVGVGSAIKPGTLDRDIALARSWFRNGEEDFRLACEFAGLSPVTVRAAALDYFAQHDSGKLVITRRRKERQSVARHRPKELEHGVSQDEIAAQAGVSQATVWRVLTGRVSPTSNSARRVRSAMLELTGKSPIAKAA